MLSTQNHWWKLIQQLLSWDYRWYISIPWFNCVPHAERNPCQRFSVSQSVLSSNRADAFVIKMSSSGCSIWEKHLFLLYNIYVCFFAKLGSTGKQWLLIYFLFCYNRRFWSSCKVNWSRRPELLPLQAELMYWTSSKVLQEIYTFLSIAITVHLSVAFFF